MTRSDSLDVTSIHSGIDKLQGRDVVESKNDRSKRRPEREAVLKTLLCHQADVDAFTTSITARESDRGE